MTILEIKNIADPDASEKIYQETKYEFDPLSIGIPRCELIDLRGGSPSENAEHFIKVLEGGNYTNPKRDAVILNAGVGCYVYGLVNSIEDGCTLARQTLYDGKAATLLQEWIKVSQQIGNNNQ